MVFLSTKKSKARWGILILLVCFSADVYMAKTSLISAFAQSEKEVVIEKTDIKTDEVESIAATTDSDEKKMDLQKRLDMVKAMLRANKPELAEKLEEDRKKRREKISQALSKGSDENIELDEQILENEDESIVKDETESTHKAIVRVVEEDLDSPDKERLSEKSLTETDKELEEVEIDSEFKKKYTSVFDSALAMKSIDEEILPVEVVYLDKDARPSRGLGKKRGVRGKSQTQDIPLEKIVPEYVPHKWYPKNEQFTVYKLSCPSAFLPKRRTSSFMYKYGVRNEKAYDRFLGNQLIHDSESVDHSLYYSYAFSDNLNFTAGITMSDNSFDLNRNSSAVKNFENYRNAVLTAAGQSTIAALIKSQPVTYNPSRDVEEVTLALQAKLYSWDAYKTSLGCGIVSTRDRLKEETLTLYAGLPGLPVSFEDVFLEYQSHEAYLVFSKVIAKNLVAHVGYIGEQVKTAILTDMSRDTQDYHYPFGGIDLILNDKTRIKAGYKDGEPMGEIFYHASDELDIAAYYKSDVKIIKDDANSFDNYNILREIEDFGLSMSHRF